MYDVVEVVEVIIPAPEGWEPPPAVAGEPRTYTGSLTLDPVLPIESGVEVPATSGVDGGSLVVRRPGRLPVRIRKPLGEIGTQEADGALTIDLPRPAWVCDVREGRRPGHRESMTPETAPGGAPLLAIMAYRAEGMTAEADRRGDALVIRAEVSAAAPMRMAVTRSSPSRTPHPRQDPGLRHQAHSTTRRTSRPLRAGPRSGPLRPDPL